MPAPASRNATARLVMADLHQLPDLQLLDLSPKAGSISRAGKMSGAASASARWRTSGGSRLRAGSNCCTAALAAARWSTSARSASVGSSAAMAARSSKMAKIQKRLHLLECLAFGQPRSMRSRKSFASRLHAAAGFTVTITEPCWLT
jgi:hypothetical protein